MSSGSIPPPPPTPGGTVYLSPEQWADRRKLIKRTIIIVLSAVLLIAGLFVGGILALVFGLLKSSEPYKHSVQVATNDPRVQARLGAPVKPGWMFGGSIREVNDDGTANLNIDLVGAANKGTLYVEAKKTAGTWSYQTLTLKVQGQADLDLLQPGHDPGQEK
jgi:hypothetical protein